MIAAARSLHSAVMVAAGQSGQTLFLLYQPGAGGDR
jgi:hypothetical protein